MSERMHETSAGPGALEDLEGAGGEGGGRGDRDGEDMWTQGRFISMYDKIHYKLKKKKKLKASFFPHCILKEQL